jgi:hypothetical protein
MVLNCDILELSLTITVALLVSRSNSGSGIYLQGPPAPDQAQRRVFLDGRDMGAFNLKGETREFCRVFFAATQLPYTTHTVVVAHNDTPAMIFAMDAWL